VIGEPDPSSFEVRAGVAGQVDSQKGGEALAVSDVSLWTLGYLQLGSGSASEADIGIPHSGTTLGLRMDVPLKDDSTSSCGLRSYQS